MKFTDFFDQLIVINMASREDRRKDCYRIFKENDIPLSMVTRWSAYTTGPSPQSSGSHSHRDVIRHVANEKIKSALILEDDFEPITTVMLKNAGHMHGRQVLDTHCSILNGTGSFPERFEAMIPFLPKEYDFLLLGGAYAENPIGRYNEHVIQCKMIKGIHAYAITDTSAQKWTNWMDDKTGGDINFNCGAADDIITSASHFADFKFFILQPRLLTQRPSKSDLSGCEVNYLDSMTNPHHENLFPGGPV